MAVILIGNSFSRLVDFDSTSLASIKKALTYKDAEVAREKQRIFMQMQRAKNMGNNRMYYGMKAQLAELPPETVCWLLKDKFPTGHLNIVKEALRGVSFKVLDKREPPGEYLTLRWDNRPPSMRYYQEEMTALADKHERGVFEAAVGSGKSRVITELIKTKGVNTLIVVPSLALQEQLFRTLVMAFGSSKVGIYNAASVKSKKKLKPIRITNIQAVAALSKKEQAHKLLEDVDMFIVDEVHHAGARTYTDLLGEIDHIYYRYGFTGTFLRNDSKTMDMHGFLSNRLYHYPPSKATSEGYLTPVTYVMTDLSAKAHRNYQKEYDINYCGNPRLLNEINNIIDEIPNDEQILILVKRKEKSGEVIKSFLEEQGIDCTYVSGDNKKEEINNAIEAFNDRKIKILIGSTVIGEGVDVHSTQNLILCTGGKSEVEFVQACGRAVRLSPGKTNASIYDFFWRGSFYLQSHSEKRLKMFQSHFEGELRER